MFKTILAIILIYWTFKMFRNMAQPMRPTPPPPAQAAFGVSELVKDPVCETYIDKTTAIFSKGHYFCSETCVVKFKERS